MKINLIDMILNNAERRCLDCSITDNSGKQLDVMHALDYMSMEMRKVRSYIESSIACLFS